MSDQQTPRAGHDAGPPADDPLRPEPIRHLNTPCPYCNRTVLSLDLTGRFGATATWRGECSRCGSVLKLTATGGALDRPARETGGTDGER